MTISKEEIRVSRRVVSEVLAGLAEAQYRRKKMRGLLSSDASCLRETNDNKLHSIKTAAMVQKNVHDAKVNIQAAAKVRDAYIGFLKSNYVSIVNYINAHHSAETREFFVILYNTLIHSAGILGGIGVLKKIDSKHARDVSVEAYAEVVVTYGYVKIP